MSKSLNLNKLTLLKVKIHHSKKLGDFWVFWLEMFLKQKYRFLRLWYSHVANQKPILLVVNALFCTAVRIPLFGSVKKGSKIEFDIIVSIPSHSPRGGSWSFVN